MIFELFLIMWQAIVAIVPGDACGALEEVLEVVESLLEALGMAFYAPGGGWTAVRGELGASHVGAWLCVAFEELGMLVAVPWDRNWNNEGDLRK